jgi:hypothetical protein
MTATPGYFSLIFKFHVKDSVSDSSWNSVSLRKSFNYSNCIKPVDTAKKDIHLHYCAIVIMKFESETIKSGGLISYRSSKERFQFPSPFSARNICLILKHFKLDHNLQSTGEDSLRRQTKLRLYETKRTVMKVLMPARIFDSNSGCVLRFFLPKQQAVWK